MVSTRDINIGPFTEPASMPVAHDDEQLRPGDR
jgi:hypothetical protein